MIVRWRKKPVEFDAIQWTGHNLAEMQKFCGTRPTGDWDIDANRPHVLPVFTPHGTFIGANPIENAGELWVEANKTILLIEVGEWVIKDELGFYPCKDEIIKKNNTPLRESV